MIINKKKMIDILLFTLFLCTSIIVLFPVAFIYVFLVLFLFSIPLLLAVNISFLLFQSSIIGDALSWIVLFAVPFFIVCKMKQRITKMKIRHRIITCTALIVFFFWVVSIYEVLSNQ